MKNKTFICILLVIILIVGSSIRTLATDIGQNDTNLNDNVVGNQQGKMENGQANNTENGTHQQNTNDENRVDQSTIDDLNSQKEEAEKKVEEANKQLEYVQGEMSNMLLEIQKLDDKIRQYESENNELNNKLIALEKSIQETKVNLEIVTQDYTQKDNILRERLVVLYEEGEISFLDVLLSSNSLTDFLSKYFIMEEMAEHDMELIEKLEKEKKQIELSQKKMENESAQAKILKARAEQSELILKNTKTLQEGYIEKLSEEEKKINNEMSEYKSTIYRIESILQNIANGEITADIQYTGGTMLWPVAINGTVITSSYGTREHPIAGVIRFHQGLDIGNTGYGAPVVAAADGIVTYAGELGSYGNCIMINHGNGITTVYAHGMSIEKQKGDIVKQGDIVLRTGSTGNSTGPHLHFEVRVNGSTVNPLQYVNVPI